MAEVSLKCGNGLSWFLDMPTPTSLSLNTDDAREPPRRSGRGGLIALVLLLVLALGALGFVQYRTLQQLATAEQQVADLSARSAQAAALAQQAADRAAASELASRAAAEGRLAAEAQSADAREQADTAQQEATSAREKAAAAEAEAEAIRRKAEAEVARLEEALGRIAETRRTALGLTMSLGSDHLKFEFDKADLRPEDRELLSRIAGILMTAHDYTISVNGHTDDVGSAAYNQKLSERRAQAVRDYLVKAGLTEEILSVQGHGKSLPLVKGTSDAARAKNRRVELGIVSMQIRYGTDKAPPVP
jgi:outer membrane protein OmpA-like peptidoglycan-associated protein